MSTMAICTNCLGAVTGLNQLISRRCLIKCLAMRVYGCASCLILMTLAFSGLRFWKLGQKLYWVDEAITSRHITAEGGDQVLELLQEEKPSHLAQVRNFLRLSDATITGTVRSLREEDPHHTPLYYILLNRWALGLGLAPARLRLLSALFSFLSLFAIGWLAFELFESKPISIATAFIFAASPFELIYAQQAREYSFWILLILIATTILLKLLRNPAWSLAFAYFIVITALLYTHVFSICVLLAHGCVVVVLFHRNRMVLVRYGTATLAALLLFVPWIVVMVTRLAQLRELNSGVAEPLNQALYLETFLLNLVRPVLDLGLPSYQHLPYRELQVVLPLCLILGIVVTSTLFFALHASALQRTVLFALAISSIFPLAAMDIVAGGRRALLPRYDSPTWIVLHIVLAFFCVRAISSGSRALKIGGLLATGAVLLSGIVTDELFFSRSVWWTSRPPELAQVVTYLESQTGPFRLIVDEQDFHPNAWIGLSYSLPDVPLILVGDAPVPPFPDGTAYAVHATPDFASRIFVLTGQTCVPVKPWLCKLELPKQVAGSRQSDSLDENSHDHEPVLLAADSRALRK